MLSNSSLYPVALLAIIGGAIYLVVGDMGKPNYVDMAKYRTVCEKYLNAQPGTVSQDELQLMVYEINYLLPSSVSELTDPIEKSVKTCADTLTARLANTVDQK